MDADGGEHAEIDHCTGIIVLLRLIGVANLAEQSALPGGKQGADWASMSIGWAAATMT